MNSLQSIVCYLSQMPRMLFSLLACAACRHAPGLQTHNRTGAALVETRTVPLLWVCWMKREMHTAENSAKQHISLSHTGLRLLLILQHFFY